jgi:hypothetical protein
VTLEAVPEDENRFHKFLEWAQRGMQGADLALGLLRGSISIFYRRLIPYAQTGDLRLRATASAVDFGDLAVGNFRVIDHDEYLATALFNTSNAHSDLAALQTSRQERAQALQHAIAYIEEAIQLYRALGLQAEVATSLNNASGIYRAMAQETKVVEGQVKWLEKGLACIEEAVSTFRAQGIVPYLLVALANAVMTHLMLAERSGRVDREHVLALCAEGAELAARMEDQPRGDFFQEVQKRLA